MRKQWCGFVGVAKVNLVAIELPIQAMARTSRWCSPWPSRSTARTCTLFLLQYQKSSSNWNWLVAYPCLCSATLPPRTQHDLAHCSLLVVSSPQSPHAHEYLFMGRITLLAPTYSHKGSTCGVYQPQTSSDLSLGRISVE